MEMLARLGVATVELLEAEGRSLRRHLVRLAIAAGCGVALLILALSGFAWLLYGVVLLLSQYMRVSYAAMLVGGGAIVLAAAGVMTVKQALYGEPHDRASGQAE